MKNPRSKDNFTRSRQGATRFFTNTLFGMLVFQLLFLSCMTTRKFEGLVSGNKEDSLLYILRPVQPSQSLFSFDAELYGFEGHFKNGKRNLVTELSLGSGEYSVLKLRPGFYSLKCKDMDKIFLLKEGERSFLSLELFARGTFSLPGLFIRELDTEAALRYLLEGNRMNQIMESPVSPRQ